MKAANFASAIGWFRIQWPTRERKRVPAGAPDERAGAADDPGRAISFAASEAAFPTAIAFASVALLSRMTKATRPRALAAA